MIDAEQALLAERGHDVVQYFASNSGIVGQRGMGALRAGLNVIWSGDSHRALTSELQRVRPDIVHVHNTFASLSPSVFWAANAAGVPVVFSLHNFRITCATSVLLRDGSPCEECVGHLPIPALIHGCTYVGSRAVGTALAASQLVHRVSGTYRHKVDAFITLTDFARDIFLRAGLPPTKVHVKPNCIPAPAALQEAVRSERGELVFVGMVLGGKGVDLLLEASRALAVPHHLTIVGDGPQRAEFESAFPESPRLTWTGHIPRQDVFAHVARSRWLVLPCRWYEGFPMVILEALAAGRPVIVPDHGAFPAIVWPNRNALLFKPNDAGSLRQALDRALSMPDEEWAGFSRAASELHATSYSPPTNYARLMEIYEAAIKTARSATA